MNVLSVGLSVRLQKDKCIKNRNVYFSAAILIEFEVCENPSE